MKIQFKQNGGGIPPFNYYAPVTHQGSTSEMTTGDSKDNKDDLSMKDLLDLLKDMEGLPSDVQLLANLFLKFFQFGDTMMNPSSLASSYLGAISRIKTAKFNKGYYDKIYQDQVENGGLNEVAITDQGLIKAYNEEGKLITVDINEYLQNKEKYQPITNSNILYLRAHNNAFDNNLLNVAENGIGLETVGEMIMKNIERLGTSETRIGGYSKTINSLIQQGFNVLEGLVNQGVDLSGITTVDGLYKSDIINKNQYNQITKALQYAYTMLPKNAQTLLQYKSDGHAQDLILQLLMANSSDLISFDPTLQKNPDGTSSSGSGEGSNKMNTVEQWLRGYGQVKEYTLSNGTQDGIKVWGNELPIVKPNGDPISNTNLQQVINSQYAGAIDQDLITMGGVRISPESLSKVMFSGQAKRIDFPIDIYDLTGTVKPDLDLLDRLNEAQQYIRDNNITDKQEINKVYQDHKLPFMYNNDGSLNTSNWATFMVLNGVAIDSAFEDKSELRTNQFLKEVDDSDKINDVLNVLQGALPRENQKIDYDKSAFLGRYGGRNHMFEGNIFIPINPNVFSAKSGNGQEITPELGTHLQGLQEVNDRKLLSEQMRSLFVLRSLVTE